MWEIKTATFSDTLGIIFIAIFLTCLNYLIIYRFVKLFDFDKYLTDDNYLYV